MLVDMSDMTEPQITDNSMLNMLKFNVRGDAKNTDDF